MEHHEPGIIAEYAGIQAIYNNVAADIFKQQYYPADPFHGELIDAAFLEVDELVAVFKAAKALVDEGKAAFTKNLIHYRGSHTTPAVRVNSLWLKALRIRKGKICAYVEASCFNNRFEVQWYKQKIEHMNEPQLLEYLHQAQEVLDCEAEVTDES